MMRFTLAIVTLLAVCIAFANAGKPDQEPSEKRFPIHTSKPGMSSRADAKYPWMKRGCPDEESNCINRLREHAIMGKCPDDEKADICDPTKFFATRDHIYCILYSEMNATCAGEAS